MARVGSADMTQPDDGELSDQQIQEMLAGASERLKQKATTIDVSNTNTAQSYNFPKLQTGKLERPYVQNIGDVAVVDDKRLLDRRHRQQASTFRKVDDPVTTKKMAIEKKKATAGSEWFNMPRTDLTPQLKRDLQLLKMRNVLDPHRHYKKDGGKMKAPDYSQVGTIIEGPTEYFSGRVENKKRKMTFVEEVLAGEQETGRFKRKYGELQDKKTSGKKAFYKELKAKRNSGVKKGG